jgi:hypothetical protein
VNVSLTLTDAQVAEIARQVAEIIGPTKEPWLSVAQASEAWGIKPGAVRKRAARGSIESRHEGPRTLLVRRRSSNEGLHNIEDGPTT